MTIIFYNSENEKNVVVKQLTNGTTITGTLRMPTSVLNPVVMIENSTFPTWNYAYITEFSRYYFITNVVSVREDLWQIEMRVDVLMSFNAEIVSCNAYVARNETALSIDYLPETSYPVSMLYKYTSITPTTTTGSWYGGDPFGDTDITHERYIIQCQGIVNDANLNTISHKFSVPTLRLSYSEFNDFADRINSAVSIFGSKTIADCVVNAYILPVTPNAQTHGSATLHMPGWSGEIIAISANTLVNELYKEVKWKFTIPTISTTLYDKYKRLAPYHRFYMQFLPFGVVELDASYFDFVNSIFYITAKINVISGDCVLYYGKTGYEKYLTSGNARIDLPFTSEAYELGTALTGMSELVGSIASENYNAILPSITTMVNSFTPTNTTTKTGAYQFIDNEPTIIMASAEQSATSSSLFGHPVYDYGTLNTFYGYTEVERVHLLGFETATEDELNQIESLLKSGVILPSP